MTPGLFELCPTNLSLEFLRRVHNYAYYYLWKARCEATVTAERSANITPLMKRVYKTGANTTHSTSAALKFTKSRAIRCRQVIEYSSGDRTEPCGTPHTTSCIAGTFPFSTTWDRPRSHMAWQRRRRRSERPRHWHLAQRSCLHTPS